MVILFVTPRRAVIKFWQNFFFQAIQATGGKMHRKLSWLEGIHISV